MQIVIGSVIPPIPPLFHALIHAPRSYACFARYLWQCEKDVGKYLNAINAQPFIQPELAALSLLSTTQRFQALKTISPGSNALSTYIAQDTGFSLNKVVTTRMSIQRSINAIAEQYSSMASLIQEAIRSGEGLCSRRWRCATER